MPSYAITGAARGLGYGLVAELARRPSTTVFGLVRNTSTADELKALAAQKDNVHVLQADVTKPKEMTEAAAKVSQVTGGSLDVLIHNANNRDVGAMMHTPSAYELDDSENVKGMFEREFEVDLYGTIWVTNAFLPLIEKGQQKKIVHITSGLSDLEFTKNSGVAYAVPYSVGKAVMNMLVVKYAADLKDKGIKVLSMSPGFVDTMPPGTEPPPQMKAAIGHMVSQFQRVDPSLTGPISVEESVNAQLEVIDRLDENMSGEVVSHHGNREWF